jgi:hypothetical protein
MVVRLPQLVLVLGVALAASSVGSEAQFAAHFSLPRPNYLSGEPVFVDFEVQNTDSEPLRIQKASAYSFCDGYGFEATGLRRRDVPSCSEGSAGGCSFRLDTLRPGEMYSEHILLNHYFDLRKPGTYDVHATRQLSYQSVNANLAVPGPQPHAEFEAYFTITIDKYGTIDLQSVFEPFVRDLESSDLKRKFEAAEVIADLAPAFLGATLVDMLNSRDLQTFGVRGLRTLATPEAHQALAEFVKNFPPTNEFGPYQEAIRALGEIGDASDVDLLLSVAHANAQVGASRILAIEAAGEAGGDSAVGPLATELSQSSADARVAAVRALYLTGSRSAIPILIDLLRSPQEKVAEAAAYGLSALTHHDVGNSDAAARPSASYAWWAQWWLKHGATARIFKPTKCGNTMPTP